MDPWIMIIWHSLHLVSLASWNVRLRNSKFGCGCVRIAWGVIPSTLTISLSGLQHASASNRIIPSMPSIQVAVQTFGSTAGTRTHNRFSSAMLCCTMQHAQAFFNAILDPFNTSPSPDANEPNTSDRRLSMYWHLLAPGVLDFHHLSRYRIFCQILGSWPTHRSLARRDGNSRRR